jgi:hypothetical protein
LFWYRLIVWDEEACLSLHQRCCFALTDVPPDLDDLDRLRDLDLDLDFSGCVGGECCFLTRKFE